MKIKQKIIIFVFNFSLLFINIYLFNVYIKKIIFIKSSDEYIFFNKNYTYFINNIDLLFNNSISKEKKISLICKDTLDDDGCSLGIKKILEKKLNSIVDIREENPDYLIYDVFGCKHMSEKYKNSVKIAKYSENIIPDFSEADYAISQAHIIYLDRYFKYPSFIWRLKKFNNTNVVNIFNFIKNVKKYKFCAAVISNHGNNSLFRLDFIKQLNNYKHVDMGGKFSNDIGRYVKNKIEFLKAYKFSISMENSNGDGYISEKIIDSFLAGTIPIYYGDYLIDEYINPKVYILIKGEKDIHKKIDYIKKIDKNDSLYNSIIKEPIFINDKYTDIMKKIEDERSKFFYNIFLQGKNNSKRIDDVNINYNCLM